MSLETFRRPMPSTEVFRRDNPVASLSPVSNLLTLNNPAFFLLDGAEAVRLLWDGDLRVIGLEPCDPADPDAYSAKGPQFPMRRFMERYGIRPEHRTHHPVRLLWDIVCIYLEETA